MAAIIYWQIREIERAIAEAGEDELAAFSWTCFPMQAPSAGKM